MGALGARGQRLRAYSLSSTANEGRNDYHPMFFTHDRAFEELFGICIQLLNKTWKEMRATAEDFNKVSAAGPLRLLREDHETASDSWPAPGESLSWKTSLVGSAAASQGGRTREPESQLS